VDRAHRAISACNQILVHAADEAALLRQICQVVAGPDAIASPGGPLARAISKTIRAAAQAGFEEGSWTSSSHPRLQRAGPHAHGQAIEADSPA